MKPVQLFFLYTVLLTIPLYLLNHYSNYTFNFGNLQLPPSVVGIFIPSFVATYLIFKSTDKEGFLRFFKYTFKITPDFWKWIFRSIAIAPISSILIAGLKIWANPQLTAFLPNIFSFVPMLFLYVVGAIPEEIGWTAFATHFLQKSYKPIQAGTMIGIIWGLWHVPAYISMGHNANWIILQVLITTASRILMGQIYSASQKNFYTAICFHGTLNAFYSDYFSQPIALLIFDTILIVMIHGNPFTKLSGKIFKIR